MSFSFLIDECLSPELAQLAIAKGYTSSTCVRDRGWTGKKDRELMTLIIQHDFTLVTKNNIDFRGEHPPAPGGLYASQHLAAYTRASTCMRASCALILPQTRPRRRSSTSLDWRSITSPPMAA